MYEVRFIFWKSMLVYFQHYHLVRGIFPNRPFLTRTYRWRTSTYPAREKRIPLEINTFAHWKTTELAQWIECIPTSPVWDLLCSSSLHLLLKLFPHSLQVRPSSSTSAMFNCWGDRSLGSKIYDSYPGFFNRTWRGIMKHYVLALLFLLVCAWAERKKEKKKIKHSSTFLLTAVIKKWWRHIT